jgi:hypothetical protein
MRTGDPTWVPVPSGRFVDELVDHHAVAVGIVEHDVGGSRLIESAPRFTPSLPP